MSPFLRIAICSEKRKKIRHWMAVQPILFRKSL